MRKSMRDLEGVTVTVGIHGEDGDRETGRATNVQVAAIHEFGDPARKIPERSFLRSTFDNERAEILDDMADAMDRTIEFGHIEREIPRVGIFTEKRVRDTIRRGLTPDISDATKDRRRKKLKQKGEVAVPANSQFGTTETPLIDTGQLIQSIASKVEHR